MAFAIRDPQLVWRPFKKGLNGPPQPGTEPILLPRHMSDVHAKQAVYRGSRARHSSPNTHH